MPREPPAGLRSLLQPRSAPALPAAETLQARETQHASQPGTRTGDAGAKGRTPEVTGQPPPPRRPDRLTPPRPAPRSGNQPPGRRRQERSRPAAPHGPRPGVGAGRRLTATTARRLGPASGAGAPAAPAGRGLPAPGGGAARRPSLRAPGCRVPRLPPSPAGPRQLVSPGPWVAGCGRGMGRKKTPKNQTKTNAQPPPPAKKKKPKEKTNQKNHQQNQTKTTKKTQNRREKGSAQHSSPGT